MLLKPEPIFAAVEAVTAEATTKPRVVLLCPQGERFTQHKAEELSKEEHLVFICGHYEGYDERIREYLVTDELSYTRPANFKGLEVPAVLLSGNHAKIDQWREEQSLIRTYERRKDLLETAPLSDHQIKLLEKLKREAN